MRIRPAEDRDLDQLMDLAKKGGDSLTTLPKDEKSFLWRIADSQKSFRVDRAQPGGETFFMVIEEDNAHVIVGTTALYTHVGARQAFYNFRLSTLTHISHELKIKHHADVLTLVNDYTGTTELGTLFLSPDHRGGGNGKLLSRSRFLLMAAAPERFDDVIMAEIRGWLDADGRSPFWDALGRHFFRLPFSQADNISGNSNNQFIADLMPKHPIYLDLLPESAKAVVGKPHDHAAPAYGMLSREGLRYNRAVDVFDAGPILDAPREEIHSIRTSRRGIVKDIRDNPGGQRLMVATTNLPKFRAAYGEVKIEDDGALILDKAAAKRLEVQPGGELVYVN